MKDSAIGVFDSGVGGLTCVKELINTLPNENIIYLGDTARIPYGTRSAETIYEYALQDAAFLQEHNVKMIIVACGTVSSVMLKRPIFDKTRLFTGVVYPAAAQAVKSTKNKKIGVIGTSATIKSGSYEQAIKELDPDITVVTKACPMFVPLVENGYTDPNDTVALTVAKDYLKIMQDEGVDTMIMGCTHYPLLEEVFKNILGDEVELVSSGAEAAKYAKRILWQEGLLSDRKEPGTADLYCTDSVELFTENVENFLGHNINARISQCVLK